MGPIRLALRLGRSPTPTPPLKRRGLSALLHGLFARLGKHSRGKSCLYIKKLADVDLAVLERLVGLSWEVMGRRYGG